MNYFVLEKSQSKQLSSYRVLKRTFDFTLAIITSIIFLPFLAIVALMIKMHDGASPLFIQERIGENGVTFKCFKFRTMVVDAEQRLESLLKSCPEAAKEWALDQKLRNDPRITKLGQFLRKTSLDELPQLINIVKNEMSFVGPRPIVESEIIKYGKHIIDYAACQPGVTGLWQISGRNNTTYEERVQLDVTYSKTKTMFGDMKILVRTIPAVLFSKGAY